jgi:non-ribosomal peptide synthetase component E (peptide arylation enzyme)
MTSQGKRIWILRTQVSGRKVDSGGIGQLLVAEIHAFEGNVRANNTVRSQIQTASGFFCSSDVKEIPNAFALNDIRQF